MPVKSVEIIMLFIKATLHRPILSLHRNEKMFPPSKSHLKQLHFPPSIKTGDESHPLIDQRLMAAKLGAAQWKGCSVLTIPPPLPYQHPLSMDPALTPAPTALMLLMIEMSVYSLLNTWHGNRLTSAYGHRHRTRHPTVALIRIQ